jgi:hypothetical protein
MADGLFEDQVHSLTRTFHKSTLGEQVGNAPVTRILTVEDVFRTDPRRKTTRALYLKVSRILTYKHTPTKAVVAMTDGIKNSFPHRAFFEGGDVPYEQSILIVLEIVSKTYRVPQIVIERKECFPVFLALLGRA